jgi:hypothetical protein
VTGGNVSPLRGSYGFRLHASGIRAARSRGLSLAETLSFAGRALLLGALLAGSSSENFTLLISKEKHV